jgi:predicted Zn-dependent protease
LQRVAALLGASYLRTDQGAKAASLLRAAVIENPDEPRLRFLLIEALNLVEDPEGALETARETQRRFANLPQASLAFAQQLARVGKYTDAGPIFERVLAVEPANPHALLGFAESLEKSGEAARALEAYRKATPTAGIIAQLGAARTLSALRRFTEAQEELEKAVHEEPANQQVRIELARVYARLGMKDKAAEQNRLLEEIRAAVK